MVAKVTFHRPAEGAIEGKVSVEGVEVGTYRQPDPSGAAWTRALIWVFNPIDGGVHQGRSRSGLKDYARSTAMRVSRVNA